MLSSRSGRGAESTRQFEDFPRMVKVFGKFPHLKLGMHQTRARARVFGFGYLGVWVCLGIWVCLGLGLFGYLGV